MTDLARLRVSLTKHNAHKVARLLREYPAAEVMGRLGEVQAEAAQARKNLSALKGDILPPVWAKAKALGDDAIDALVLIGIIFSHHELISAMKNASLRQGYSGRIRRNTQLSGKEYTNFVRIIDQLEYATKLDNLGVTFNLKKMFEIPGLGPLAGELLTLKLIAAGWDKSNSVSEESVRLEFQNIFGVTAMELSAWLDAGAQPTSAGSTLSAKDEEFFQDGTEGGNANPFVFTPGHTERDVEPITKSGSAKSKANRLHNDIQNRLFEYLKGQLGPNAVSTENGTGSGTSIDAVTCHAGKVTFYEIKTGPSVRSSIRQAIPQLLEYAYWPCEKRADELIIVSHLPITKDAKDYLDFLHNQFKIPISYRQFDMSNNRLV